MSNLHTGHRVSFASIQSLRGEIAGTRPAPFSVDSQSPGYADTMRSSESVQTLRPMAAAGSGGQQIVNHGRNRQRLDSSK